MTVTRAAVAWLAVAAALTGPAGDAAQSTGAPAWAIIEWESGAVATGAGLDRLREPAQPGAILKNTSLVLKTGHQATVFHPPSAERSTRP